MTAEEIIERYGCSERDGGMLYIRNADRMEKDGKTEEVRRRKQEILQAIRDEGAAEKKAYEEYVRKVDSIEGLREVKTLKEEWENYHDSFNRMMEDQDNDGLYPPKKPDMEVRELLAKYPRASAYLRAEAYSHAAHFVKVSAGKKARERILNGEDYRQAISDMETEWQAYCETRAWD